MRVFFNLLLAAICVISVIMCCVVLPGEYRKSVKKGWKAVRIIGFVLAAGMLVLATLSMDYTGKPCVTGELIEVRFRGVSHSVFDRCELVVKTEDGTEYHIEEIASVPPWGKSRKEAEDLSVGSTYRVYGSTVTRAFFYAVELVPDD